jgi:hypothetical protein
MRRYLLIALTVLASLAVAGSAQALVVNDAGSQFGVALQPGTSLPGGVSAGGSPCATVADPGLPADLSYRPATNPLCWHGGPVLHQNETFAFTWDPARRYWETTRNYVEQFLRNVASGSGALGSPFALTGQYWDGSLMTNRAQNSSLYGGGCIDYGNPGGYTCQLGNTTGSGTGQNYPTGVCPATSPSDICLTDAQVAQEVSYLVGSTHLASHTATGYTPLVVVMTPLNVEVCLDSGGTMCSANSSSAGRFCSYHSQVNGIAYVVQPWTRGTACDEPGLPTLPTNPTPQQLETDAGVRLVNPLSQAQMAAIVDPALNGWFATDGSEVNDNGGCTSLGPTLDSVSIGAGSYVIQREFNNAAMIVSEPYTYGGCAPSVVLDPAYVVPSAVNAGDVVQFDGSTTPSTLIVSKDNYRWNFGDGTSAVGPSVEHSYTSGGNYTVTLSVTDRGGNVRTLSQGIQVLGASGQPVSTAGAGHPLHVHLLLMPQGLHAALREGVMVRVTANEGAEGVASVSVSRAVAKRAGLSVGKRPTVVIGIGTVSGIKNGTVLLHLHLSRAIAAKLANLRHVTLTVRLALVGRGGNHFAIDVAGRY